MKMGTLLSAVFFLTIFCGFSACHASGNSNGLFAGSFLGGFMSCGQGPQEGSFAQDSVHEPYHASFREATNLLHQARQMIPSDSTIIDREKERVSHAYAEVSQKIKDQHTTSDYVDFETRRLISLCYSAPNLSQLMDYQNTLFDHVAKYSSVFEKYFELNNDIAQCIVNSYESQSIWFKDTLLQYVVRAAEQHMESLNAGKWSEVKQQDFINMYAAHYYQRGIVSMAEPFFRHFKDVYGYEQAQIKTMPALPSNQSVLSAGLAATNKTFASFQNNKILLTAFEESPYNLIYLITQLRTAREAYPQTPVLILRDPQKVSNSYIMALGRNLAFSDYYIVNLNNPQGIDKAACCYHEKNGQLAFAANSPVRCMEWLEEPLEEKMQAQKRQLQKNYEKLQERKKQRASLPEDNTIRYTVSQDLITVNFRGYWDTKPQIRVKQYHFLESHKDLLWDQVQLAELQVLVDGGPVYSTEIICTGSPLEVDIIAGAQHGMHTSFNDQLNRDYAALSGALDSLFRIQNTYTHLLENYPFPESPFYKAIGERNSALGPKIQEQISKAGSSSPETEALLAIKYNAMRLHFADPVQDITYDEFIKFFPQDKFDPVIWRSPYYEAWVQAWLAYGRKDLNHAIDWLFGSQQLMPEKALSQVGASIWKQMNAQGRFDVMVHLDTTWLAGCPGSREGDVQKRMEGYKRMAAGNRAPNIKWNKNGKTMDLYSMKADTIIVVFWSEDCAYCKQELPVMHHKLKDNPAYEVLAVAIDPSETTVKTGERYMPSWHHVQAEKGWDDPMVEQYNVFGTPEMYLLNKEHVIMEKRINF